jgi:trimeric autotransporter adhesin
MRAALALLLALPAAAQSAAPNFDLAALDEQGALLLFSANTPQDVKRLPLAKLAAPLVGIDTRPADGLLYGLSRRNEIYRIDMQSGAATLVSRLGSPFDGAESAGFDFNPQVDRLRLVAHSGQNLRVNVDVGAVAIDTPLRFAADDDHANRRPNVSASGYTNAVAKAARTVTFAIDDGLDILVKQEPPNDGVLRTVGALGIDCGPKNGFDIGTDTRGVDRAFIACQGALYDLNLRTGRATLIGAIGGGGLQITGLAVVRGQPGP